MKIKTVIHAKELFDSGVLVFQLDEELSLIATCTDINVIEIYVIDKHEFQDLISCVGK